MLRIKKILLQGNTPGGTIWFLMAGVLAAHFNQELLATALVALAFIFDQVAPNAGSSGE